MLRIFSPHQSSQQIALKIFCWKPYTCTEKRTVRFSQSISTEKLQKYPFRWSITNLKLLHTKKCNNARLKSLKTFTVATMELFLLNNYQIPVIIVTSGFSTLPVTDSFNHYFALFYTVNFLSLPLWTNADRAFTIHWPKTKNFIIVD